MELGLVTFSNVSSFLLNRKKKKEATNVPHRLYFWCHRRINNRNIQLIDNSKWKKWLGYGLVKARALESRRATIPQRCGLGNERFLCSERHYRLRHVYGACLSSQDIMASLTVIHFPNGIQQNGAYFHWQQSFFFCIFNKSSSYFLVQPKKSHSKSIQKAKVLPKKLYKAFFVTSKDFQKEIISLRGREQVQTLHRLTLVNREALAFP